MNEPVWQWSATRTAAAIRGGEISAEAVCEAHVTRMRAANPKINAVVVDMGDEAMARAREIDAEIAAGKPCDLLTGVPVNIKINVDVKGQANSNGVPALKDNIATDYSPVVSNLLGAGAVCIGMTNTPEFSMRVHTENPLHGETLNPWDDSITCGGSSGGAGAATAMGFGCIGHGNDIGGSLRWPAHCNGIATIRPTQGRIPAFNPSATAERPHIAQLFSTQGPLARSVADVRLGLEVMARRDPRDPNWVPAPLSGPTVPRRAALAKIPEGAEVDPEVVTRLRAAADALADSGWDVHEVDVPDVRAAWTCWMTLLTNEMSTGATEDMLKVTSPAFHKSWLSADALAEKVDMKGFVALMAERLTWIRRWMLFLEDYPVVLCPTLLGRTFAKGADATGDMDQVRKLWSNDMMFVGLFNLLGLPSVVTPIGMVGGVPAGAQVVASRYREDVALMAAEAIEAKLGRLAPQLWAREG